jgi:hypothetical protein
LLSAVEKMYAVELTAAASATTVVNLLKDVMTDEMICAGFGG